jgi:pimeloyl-ACP methyl ester carboxylesterase/DNA-binding winged helix-turn-helix (wHTH) protein
MTTPVTTPAKSIHFGPFRLDVGSHRLWKGGQEIILAPKAIDLLVYLAERPNVVVSRSELFAALWPNTFVDDHALSVQILDIRKALGDRTAYIETRPRRGYRFVIPEETEPAMGDAGQTSDQVGACPTVETPPMPATRYARSCDVNIAYQVVGSGPIDLVFVMGWVSHMDYYWANPLFARFLSRLSSFTRLILFDKRGTGLSDRVPLDHLPTLEQRMDDVRAVMQAVGSERAAILGVSEGGPMSSLFAATYPERTLGLVMIGTYARRLRDSEYPWGTTVEERDEYCRRIVEEWGGPVGIDTRAPSLLQNAAFRNWWSTYLRMGASPSAAVALTRMNAEIDVRDVLPAVRVPTLVIHRSQDMCLKVEEGRYLASVIPGAAFVELPGADHLPFVGDQDSILDEIETFLRGLNQKVQAERVLVTALAADVQPVTPSLRGRLKAEVEWFRGTWLAPPEGLDGCISATFDGPARAIRCANGIARQAAQARIQFRAGLHTGECDRLPGGAFRGPALELAREVCRMAPNNEILVSSTLKDLVAGSGIAFRAMETLVSGEEGSWALHRIADR